MAKIMIEPVPFFGLLSTLILLIIAIVVGLLFLGLNVLCLKRVRPGEAGVRTGFGGLRITKDWLFCYPFLHRWDTMEIQVKKLDVARKGKDCLICQDNIRVDIEVSFYLRVGADEESIREVAETVGCEAAADLEILRNMFEDKFLDALNVAVKQMDSSKLYTDRSKFRGMIVRELGEDLNGYLLEDVAISYLEQANKGT